MGGVGRGKWGGNAVYIVLMYEAVKKLMLKKRTTSHGFILRTSKFSVVLMQDSFPRMVHRSLLFPKVLSPQVLFTVTSRPLYLFLW